MRDYGIDKGSVKQFDTTKKEFKNFFGLRKMFWDYLKKLNVPFYDPCCAAADDSDRRPVAWDESQGQFVAYDGTSWVAVTSFTTTTTSTTTTTTL